MITILIFSLAYTLKGGQFPLHFGKLFSCFWVFDYLILFTDLGLARSIFLTAAWLLAIAPSMGEEAGAIGRFGYWWGKYRDRGFDRSYGVLKGFQRGAFMGAAFTLALHPDPVAWHFIPTLSFAFVIAHYLGQEIYFREFKKDNWVLSEAMLGSIIGLCVDLSLGVK